MTEPEETAARRTRARRALDAVGIAGGIVATAFVVREAMRLWPRLARLVSEADPAWLLASALGFALFELLYAFGWPATLRALGFAVPGRRSMAIFLVTQMAKFVPGGVWHIVGRVGAFRRLGVPAKTSAGAMVLEASFSVAAAVAIFGSSGTLSGVLDPSPFLRAAELAACVAGVAGALAGGRMVAGRFGTRLSGRHTARIALLHLAVWLGYGVSAAALAHAMGLDAGRVPGAFAVSWLAGFLVVGAPSGLGVREAVMIAVLRPTIGPAGAVAVAAGSRAVWTGIQLAAACVSAPVVAAGRRIVPAA